MNDPKGSMDIGAFYADETPLFRYPEEAYAGDEVTFRFRVRADEEAEIILLGSVFRYPMHKAFRRGIFDYYECKTKIGDGPFYYAYQITGRGERYLFNRFGPSKDGAFHRREAFAIFPGFATPDWAKGAVMYQIYIDRFCNGDESNDVLSNEYVYVGHPVERVTDWNAPIHGLDVFRFYGGDLVGLYQKLDYLSYLGVEAIYLNPIFLSPSNHKYDTQDYDYIDPHLVGFLREEGNVLTEGDSDNKHATLYQSRTTDPVNLENANQFFAKLTEEIHKRGMKIILDGVFNHAASFHRWMDRERIYEDKEGYAPGAYLAKDSPYHDYFYFNENNEWPNADYISWYDVDTLPKLNYSTGDGVSKEIFAIAEKWLRPPYNIDGWRLDVAADLGDCNETNHAFWKKFRKVVKAEKKDALIVAEHYSNPHAWLKGDEWDTVMNYDGFMDPVGFFLTGMEKHCYSYDASLHGNGDAFFKNLLRAHANIPTASIYTAMNELSNHDHARFLTRTKSKVGTLSQCGREDAGLNVSYATFREGVVMQFTLPGAPTIYYGDETGMVGWTDPDSRRTYPWGHEAWDVIAFHKDIIAIHKKYSALKTGSFKPIGSDYGMVAYGRFDERNAVLTVINHSDYDRTIRLRVSEIDMPEDGEIVQILQTNDAGYNVGTIRKKICGGFLETLVPAWSATIYAKENDF